MTRDLDALRTLDAAIDAWEPSHVFALFSGGHDSLTSTALAAGHQAFTAAVHINTGIGIDETRDFVRETCREQGWPLLEYHPPVSYDDIVLEHGFPGPGAHRFAYVRLKERCLDALVREHKVERRRKIVLVTGARAQESRRRMGHVEPVQIERESVKVWVAPIHDWTKDDCNSLIERRGLRRNPVVDAIHMSGECLCGSFANAAQERPLLGALYPSVERRIRELELRAEAAGVVACEWGKRPPNVAPGQERLDFSPLCRCDLRAA